MIIDKKMNERTVQIIILKYKKHKMYNKNKSLRLLLIQFNNILCPF